MAQDASSWVTVSPEDEMFTVIMPQAPALSDRKYQQGRMNVTGKLYSVENDNASYRIWSLDDLALTGSALTHADAYLDACADLIWEALLKPEREKIEESKGKSPSMRYRRELPSTLSSPGREYSIILDTVQGVVHFYITTDRIYVLVAVSAPAYNPALLDPFLKSFATTNPKAATLNVDPMLFPPDDRPIHYGNPTPATGGNTSTGAGGEASNRIFSPLEVTQRAGILSKPEPLYTDEARKYGVSGTVILRAIFSSAGEVTNIRVVSKLPHGLTEQCIAAARGIKFRPAIKDGRQVSQYIQMEYNFNLY
jgi:TonB family protein